MTILFKNVVILVLEKTIGTLFLPKTFRKLKAGSYANSFQTTTLTSFKDTVFIKIFFYCDRLCNCAFKKEKLYFQPISHQEENNEAQGWLFR